MLNKQRPLSCSSPNIFFGTRKLFSVAALSSINLVLKRKPSVNFYFSYFIYLEFILTWFLNLNLFLTKLSAINEVLLWLLC